MALALVGGPVFRLSAVAITDPRRPHRDCAYGTTGPRLVGVPMQVGMDAASGDDCPKEISKKEEKLEIITELRTAFAGAFGHNCAQLMTGMIS